MKHKDILLIVIPSFLLIVVWIVFTIVHNSISSTIPQALGIQIKPITPSFDTATLESLKKRSKVQPLYQINIPEVIVSPSPVPLSSSSSSLNPTNEGQGGNQLP